ncbi:TauD/TfdA family dioxygenase [Jeongeupia wiesaeckerbachi]|uniref:TauD/TfdA family dioxygenase n=1 Tax=Jeongeupia wiesaeckerbachi TaxID=3051218 RepID=UPI003D80429B
MQTQTIEVNGLRLTPGFPLRVSPVEPGASLQSVLPAVQALVADKLYEAGGLFFTGFAADGIDAFRAFAASFGHGLLSYEFGSTPRSKVGGEGVYTSTEYPAHQHIPLHNEQAYTREWPMKIWFYCDIAAEEGGETPIADSRAIFRDIDPEIRARFAEKGLMYVRNSGNGLDVPWQQVFNTEVPAEVEAYCAAHQIQCEWLDDGELRTRQVCQGTARHPVTGDEVWFNQAHLFHVSALEADMREALVDAVGEEFLPRNVYYGDGSVIDDATLAHVRSVLDKHKVAFPWQSGDVLMLDNMLAAHARSPFKGKRKVVVAMAEGHGADAAG